MPQPNDLGRSLVALDLLTAVVGNLELLQFRVAGDERALRLASAAFQAAMRGASSQPSFWPSHGPRSSLLPS
jgi:hypothetical protein